MKITINSQQIQAFENESILQAARRNDIYIPAICYLNSCSPTLACRLCMVEADGKRVYGCNAKVKEGMQIFTNTPEIEAERNAIMQTYCINHPLECGVCDKSGECELQNMTLFTSVKEQNYAIKDTHKPQQKWGLIQYDPALCIVCERCVTVCSDKMGESALKTVARGGEQVSKDLKDTMPKDAFAIWSKFQKSLIGIASGADTLDCSMCGECTSVCPVGALVGSSFQYSSNAWELARVPAANPHSSDCELLYYDVKPKGISDREPKIYRISNDFHFAEIHAAARWGYDFANENASKNQSKFELIVNAIKSGEIKNISFNSLITNEEALLLQKIADSFNLNLINDEARAYGEFLKDFSLAAGSEYNGTYADFKTAKCLISIGSLLRYDSPITGYKFVNATKVAKANAIYLHPLSDDVIQKLGKNILAHTYAPGDELAVLLALAGAAKALDVNEFDFVAKVGEGEEAKDVAQNELANALGLDWAKLCELVSPENRLLIIGADFYTHKDAHLLALIAGAMQASGKFKVILIPPRTNSLGVAKICSLSSFKADGKTLGYNESGDYKFSVYGGDIDAAALTQQEGTFTNISRKVVPTNAAIKHKGYFLADLANALGIKLRHTIDLSKELPVNKGYKGLEFDSLAIYYAKDGTDCRGYDLLNFNASPEFELAQFVKAGKEWLARGISKQAGLVYFANPISQFYQTTARTSALAQVGRLYASPSFANLHSLNENDSVILKLGDTSLALSVSIDKNILNEYALLGDYDEKIKANAFFENGRFAKLEIKKGE